MVVEAGQRSSYELVVDADVRDTLAFMQESVPPARLVAVAEGVGALARILWRDGPQESVNVVILNPPPVL